MLMAKISGDTVVAYPYTRAMLAADYPRTSFPDTLDEGDLPLGVVRVVYASRPAEQAGVAVEEATPVRVAGEWWQSWSVRQETAGELAAAKAAALVEVDRQAEATRLLFITLGSAQALVYEAKRHEALSLAADQSPDPADYPLLSAEIGITAATLAEVGVAVLAMAGQWRAVAAGIERERLGAKAAITAATTIAAVRAASTGIAWPQPS